MSVHTPTASVSGAPVTTPVTEQLSPSLLRSEVDSRIVRMRPASTPIDQISRMCGARHSGSMKVDYYSVDMKPGSLTTTSATAAVTLGPAETVSVKLSDSGILSPSETVIFPSISVSPAGGAPSVPLTCYVKETSGKTASLIPIGVTSVPAIPGGSLMVRMGRAAGELDVQTSQYTSLPRKEFNYCQIFKAQIEESMLQRLADKEVGWTFSDQEEVAICDMRLGMEKSFLFGTRTRLDVGDGAEVYLTGGIWQQAGKEFIVGADGLTADRLVALMREAFTGGGGSRRKVLVGGSALIESLHHVDHQRVVQAADKETVWGVDFDRIVSKFGTLYVIHSEVFDLCGMPACGMVIDPEYMTKYSHVPFRAERISFAKQGVRNTEAVVLTESSCLVLRYPDSHLRILA